VKVHLHRVPFFLEPDYNSRPPDFTETHDTRMIRKFGSKETFLRVRKSHGLIPRGEAVGLNADNGWTQENLTRRIQSSTLNAHRLLLFVAQEYGSVASEKLYAELNKHHFTEAGVLNDRTLLRAATVEVLGDGAEAHACESLLDSERGKKEVLAVVDAVSAAGVNSIPTLVIDGQHVISPTAGTEEVLGGLRRAVQGGVQGHRALAVPVF